MFLSTAATSKLLHSTIIQILYSLHSLFLSLTLSLTSMYAKTKQKLKEGDFVLTILTLQPYLHHSSSKYSHKPPVRNQKATKETHIFLPTRQHHQSPQPKPYLLHLKAPPHKRHTTQFKTIQKPPQNTHYRTRPSTCRKFHCRLHRTSDISKAKAKGKRSKQPSISQISLLGHTDIENLRH